MLKLRTRLLGTLVAAAVLMSASWARADVSQADAYKAVKEAFQQWEALNCSKLEFTFEPVLSTLPQPVEQKGGITVAFFGPNDPWISASNAYFTNSDFNTHELGELESATIQLNAGKYNWVIGKEKNAIDIKTAVLHLIPNTLGFYVGGYPKTQSGENFIKYNFIDHSLLPLHERGASVSYFEAGPGCTQPQEPHVCGETPPVPDGGVPDMGVPEAGIPEAGMPRPLQLCILHSNPNDKPKGKPVHWKSQPIKVWVYAPAEGIKPPTPAGDGKVKDMGTTPSNDGAATDSAQGKPCKTTPECDDGQICSAEGRCVALGGGGDDDGCSVAKGVGGDLTATGFLLLGIGLVLWRRRG